MARKAKGEVWENPLVPHALMRRMYEAMKEMRAMEPRANARRTGGRRLHGEEACRASSLLSLEADDLISDVPGSQVVAERPRSKRTSLMTVLAPGALALPTLGDARERMTAAIGAAGALRAQGRGRLVLAYVEGGALTRAQWKQVLGTAGRAEAPIVFVLLPTEDASRPGEISDRAQGWGVPGMPVDAADAVALYRVMQESVLRARGGDGPALLECLSWRPAGGSAGSSDGVVALGRLLRDRGLLPGK